jgi:aryl-alcohol dehydrogenase-like predicted oxidoreductase
MEYRILGKTGLKTSVVGFGGIPIADLPESEAMNVISKAYDNGINFFHTAPTYGDSALKIGKALRGVRDNCIIAVKVFGSNRDRVRKELSKSLEMLQTGRIDIAQFRITETQFETAIGPNGGLMELQEAQRKGVVGHIGITDHNPKFLAKAVLTGLFSNVITPFSYIYPVARSTVIPVALGMNNGIIIMKALAGGALGNIEGALNFIWSHGCSTAIVGMRSVSEVERDASVAGMIRQMPEDEVTKLLEQGSELRAKYRIEEFEGVPSGKLIM